MATFQDASQITWTVELDGLLLAEVKDRAGVDFIQDGLFLIEAREDLLTRALLVMCAEQITAANLNERQFAKRISGETQAAAIEAVRGAAKDFFRPKKWSDIQSRLKLLESHEELYQQMRAMFDMLNRPGVPEEIREGASQYLNNMLATGMNSVKSQVPEFASGQDVTPPTSATSLQELSESTRAA